MKTMHITNAWSEKSGGVATFYRALLKAANRHEQRMCLVVPAPMDGEEDCGPFAKIYKVAAPKAVLNPNYRTIYPNAYLWRGGRVREILRRETPDLIEIGDKYTLNYLGPLLRLRLMRDIPFRPVVAGISFERMDVNCESYLSAGNLGRAFSSWYMRHLYFPFFDHHIAISNPTADELVRAGKGHEVTRGIFKLHLGVDCSLFSPHLRSMRARVNLANRAGTDASKILLLYVGRLAPEKNLSLLLQTMEHISPASPGYHLILVGDGISRDAFLTRARKELGGTISWFGHISDRHELAEIIANCDFFLHPNPREPFGIAPLEAMASGVPLIAPNSGGITAYANASNAGLTDASGAAFAATIESIARNADRRRVIIEAALRTAHSFSLETMTDRYMNLYADLHRISKREMTLEDAMPAYLSEPPSPARAKMLRCIADAAAGVYSVLAAFGGRTLAVKQPDRWS